MDKKKISTGLKVGGFVFAILTLVMFAESLITGSYESISINYSIFEYAFKRGAANGGSSIHYNAIYIVSFILALIALLSIAGVLYTHFAGKDKAQLNKGLIVVAIVSLLIVVVFAFCAKAVLKGEIYKMGVPSKYVKDVMKGFVLGKGAICQGIFGIVGAGSLALSAKLDK